MARDLLVSECAKLHPGEERAAAEQIFAGEPEWPGYPLSAPLGYSSASMRRNDSLLDLFLELQILDRVPRSGYVLRGVSEPESVTEHSWHVLFLVWALGTRIEGIDLSKAVEIALIHDLAELRVGDLPRTASHYFPEGAK